MWRDDICFGTALLGCHKSLVFTTLVVSSISRSVELSRFLSWLEGFGLRVTDIELSKRETDLLNQIRLRFASHDELPASLMPMADLTESLLEREVIPEVRLAYFTDLERNPGERGNPVSRFSRRTAPQALRSKLLGIS